MAKKEKIIDLVSKLLATADESGGATDNERDVAMQKAQSLMLKHGLEMGDVHTYTKSYGKIAEQQVVVDRTLWQGHLLHRMAPYFLCRTYFYFCEPGDKTITYNVVGRKDNRAALIAVWQFVVAQMTTHGMRQVAARDKRAQYARVAFTKYLEEHGPFPEPTIGGPHEQLDLAIPALQSELEGLDGEDQLDLIGSLCFIARNYAAEVRPFIKRGQYSPEFVEHMGVWKRSYYEGMVRVVAKNVKNFYDEVVEESSSTGKEIITQEKEALDKYFKDLDLTHNTSSAKLDADAYTKGAKDGNSIDVSGSKNKVAGSGRKELSA